VVRVFLVALFDEHALGIRHIAASLLAQGHDVRMAFLRGLLLLQERLFQPSDTERVRATRFVVTRKELELLVEECREFRPDLIGISLTSNMFGLAAEITRRFHTAFSVPVVWGGVDPTLNPELAQEHADVVCVGEGEHAMAELASRLEGRAANPLQAIDEPIDNLMIRKDGGWLSGRRGVLIEDLDSLPFATFDLSREVYIAEDQVYRGAYPPRCRIPEGVPIMSFRGCPYRCSYCVHTALRDINTGGKYLRRRSVDHMIAELRLRKAQFPDLGTVEIDDDVFTLDQKWIDRFCDEYTRHVALPFWCYTYPGISRESMLVPLRKAGLRSVTFGIQTGSQRVLREVYERPVNVEDVNKTAGVLKRLGIPFVVDIIGSNPFETDEDRIATVKVLTELPKPYLLHTIGPLTFYSRYRLTERALAMGMPLAHQPGTTKLTAPYSPRFRAWDAIMTLAQYPGIEVETLRPFWENEELMNHPRPLIEMANAFGRASYYRGNIYESKDQRIDSEQKRAACLEAEVRKLQSELATLRGSRLVRGAMAVRNLLRHARTATRAA